MCMKGVNTDRYTLIHCLLALSSGCAVSAYVCVRVCMYVLCVRASLGTSPYAVISHQLHLHRHK